jgi:hypothetical protein
MREAKSYELSVILPTRSAAVDWFAIQDKVKFAFVSLFVNNILVD